MDGAPNPASSASSVASAGSGRSNGADFKLGMFGHGVGDLGGGGGGAGAFGGSLMNGGYGLDTGTNPSSFDLSDFPSLDGGGTPGGAAAAAASNQNGLAAALRQQQPQAQLLAQRHNMLQGGTGGLSSAAASGGNNNNNSGGDGAWPALPGAPPGRTNGTNSPFMLRTGNDEKSPNVSRATSSSSAGAFYSGSSGATDVDNALEGLNQPPSGTPASLLPHQQRASTPSSTGGGGGGGSSAPPPSAGGSTLREYGLLGLLSLIRMPDSDRKALALGTDLTLFGMLENAPSKEPQYQLPICYYMQAPSLKTGHLNKFQLETLFYIFYSLPKDALQAYAAQELYERGWRYHVDLELWFKEVGPADGINVTAGSAPQYMYFDINSWERRLCSGSMMNKNITSGFLPVEETRVQYPTS